MSIIKQALFKVEIGKPNTQWHDFFFVEADSFEEALALARKVIEDQYEEWDIKSINSFAPLFKSTTKTLTIEL